jgi:hypothetical protein
MKNPNKDFERNISFILAQKEAKERGFETIHKGEYVILIINEKEYRIEFYHKNQTLVLCYDEERQFQFIEMNDLIDFILI